MAFAPFPVQIEGRDHLVARRIAFLLLDMGLGKTWCLIAAADHIGAVKLLIITAAGVRTHIAREVTRFSPARRVQVIVENADTQEIVGDTVIISYALARVPAVRRRLMMHRWHVLGLDEGQAVCRPSSKQAQAILGRGGLHEHADRIWILSGSLLPHHRIEEFWVWARALLGERRGYVEWRQHFGILRETPWGLQHVANKNITEFKALIRPHVLRRRAAGALGLPAVRQGEVTVTADLANLRALENMPELEPLRAAIAIGNDNDILAAIEQASGDALSRLRKLTGMLKVSPTLALLRAELEADPAHQIVVLAWHTAVVRSLAQGLAPFGSAIFDGSVPPRQRQRIVDSFQAGQVRALCLQIVAGGLGLEAAAGHAILVESSWSPSDNRQALARIIRPTQRRASVLCRHVVLEGSLDGAIAAVLARKAAAARELEDAA
jgi:SNF2 family DNA or RNA helicase